MKLGAHRNMSAMSSKIKFQVSYLPRNVSYYEQMFGRYHT